MTIVTHFGAKGDGKTDDTAALSHALQQGDGHLVLPRGDYRITKPLFVPLAQQGRFSLSGEGGTARLIMAGPGPAIHLVGTHRKSALPDDFVEATWLKERLPTLSHLEILGAHAEADGIRLDGVMQPTLLGLLIRKCRHGVHLVNRNRNVLITACHIYDNSGINVFLDRVNLHQIIITGSHISYGKQGGIRVANSEVRNIQITGNDIEYNFDPKNETSADVLFDAREGTIREGTIVGNTIQAKDSPNGANVRLLGVGQDNPNAVGMLTVSGNLIGSESAALHLRSCRGVVVSGNSIYNGYRHALLAEDCENLVLGPNSIDHNPDYRGKSTDQVVLRRCRNVTMTGLILQHNGDALQEVEASIEVEGCENVSLKGCQILEARVRGVRIKESRVVRVADCTIRPRKGDMSYRTAVDVDGRSTPVMVVNNFLAKGTGGELTMPPGEGRQASGNLVV